MLHALQEIGLTDSEIKVYLALLELEESSKGGILKKTKTAPSKVYHVLQKLIDKGLVSLFIKNKVKHFRAAPPEQIKYYLEKKRKDIEYQENELDKILPQLNSLKEKRKEEATAEVFYGWRGMETVYNEILTTLRKGNTNYVIGASKGEDTKRSENFFLKYGIRKTKKGIKIKILFNENARKSVRRIEKIGKFQYIKRFLRITTPVEINIFQNNTALVRLTKEPIVFLIRDKETAESFKEYFHALWATGKR